MASIEKKREKIRKQLDELKAHYLIVLTKKENGAKELSPERYQKRLNELEKKLEELK